MILKKQKIINLICKVVLLLTPLFCVCIYLFSYGKTIFDFYIPAMYYGNDELLYIKQVDAVVKYGMPYGYFGCNETHAIVGGFYAWSPFLLLGWSVIAFVFQHWNSLVLLLSNVLFMTIAFGVILILCKPSNKTILKIIFFYFVSNYITRAMFIAIPDVFCYSLSLIFFSVVYKTYNEYTKNHNISNRLLISQILLCLLLTISRPFYIIYVVFPIFYTYKSRIKNKLLMSILYCISISSIYFCVYHFLCAKYYIFTEEFKLVNAHNYNLSGGIIKLLLVIIQNWIFGLNEFLIYIGKGNYGCILMLFFTLLFIHMVIKNIISGEKSIKKEIYILCLICFLGMIFASTVFYTVEGIHKHWFEFIIWGTIVLILMDDLTYKEITMLFVILFCAYVRNPEMMKNPSKDQINLCKQEMDYIRDDLSRKMLLNKEDVPSYDNTIDWVAFDESPEKWSLLMSVPPGFGINLCYAEWFLDEETVIKSRYVATSPKGLANKKCIELGGKLIGDYEGELYIYKMY